MEGVGDTDPEFLEDPGKYFEDREKLFEQSAREGLAWWQPEKLPGQDAAPCISDLAKHRWYRPPLSPDEQIAAVRRIRSADICGPLRSSFRGFDDFTKLLAGFHGKVKQVANGHMPRRWRQRLPIRDKHTNNLFFEDLVAAGVAGMWEATLKFDLESGHRFWTGVRARVLGAISDEARLWRRHGSGEGRLDRWLYTNPTASPEQLLARQKRELKRPIYRTLEEAAEGIKLFWAWGDSPELDYDTTEREAVEIAAGSFRSMYSCFNRFTLSPQLRIHERFSSVVDRLSGGLDTGPDVGNARRPKAPEDLRDFSQTAVIQFKNGKRQATRQKAPWPAYRIPVTWALQVKAKRDLAFADRRWRLRTKRGPLPAQTHPRWSTKWLNKGGVGQGSLGRPEHENRQIVPTRIEVRPHEWEVHYRSAEAVLLSVLDCPSWHCLKPKPCKICEKARNRPGAHDVTLQLASERAVDCRAA